MAVLAIICLEARCRKGCVLRTIMMLRYSIKEILGKPPSHNVTLIPKRYTKTESAKDSQCVHFSDKVSFMFYNPKELRFMKLTTQAPCRFL